MNTADQLYSEFGYHIHQVVALIDKRGDRLFRSRLGISLAQFMLLRFIEAGGLKPVSQQDLAHKLGIAKSAVSRHIDIAKRSGWLQVSPLLASRRQNAVVLTAAGNELLGKAKALVQESESLGFAGAPAQDVEATVRTLKNLHEKLRNIQ